MKRIILIPLSLLLIVLAGYLSYRLYSGIQEPIKFEDARLYRTRLVVERLMQIREVQRLYKMEYGKFTGSFDTLAMFVKTGEMTIEKQIGSKDDSAAMARTQQFLRKNRKITEQDALNNGLVWSGKMKIPVKDNEKIAHYSFDSLRYIPIGLPNAQFQMAAKILETKSGVSVPIFEAKVDNDVFLSGLDRQLIINYNDECEKKDKYPGLSVGSLVVANNEAGNWE